MSDLFLSNTFLYSLAITLIHFLWQGCLVALVLKSALLFVDHKKPQIRYAVASMAMFGNLLLPLVTFAIVYQPEVITQTASLQFLALHSLDSGSHQFDQANNYAGLLEYLPYVSLLWLISVAYLATKLLIEIYFVNQLPRVHSAPASRMLLARFEQLVQQLKPSRKPALLISMSAKVPMAIGWLKPVILLPASMVTGLSQAQLEMLLLHELAHVQRHDYLVNFLQTLVEILLFFHPAVGWISHQMRNEREYCSDDIAVKYCGNPIAYAHTLTDTAAICREHRHHSIPNMAMAASGGDLKQRVVRLVEHHCAPTNAVAKWLASVVIIMSILLLSSQQLYTLSALENGTRGFLFSSPRPAINSNPLTNSTPLTQSSIAQQLLAGEFNNHQSPSENQFEPELTALIAERTVVQTQQLNEPLSLPVETVKNNAAHLVLPTDNHTIKQPLASDTIAAHSPIAPNENVAALTEKKAESMVELAFKHTDPKNQRFANANSYATQVTELAQPMPEKIPRAMTPPLNNEKSNDAATTSSQLRPSEKLIVPDVAAARLLSSLDPKYPTMAKRKGIELEVTVHFTIGIDGNVHNLQFETGSKISYFRREIREAMEQWHFLPARANGKPVASEMSKIFSFSLTT